MFASLRRWLNRRTSAPRCRPTVEALEDRCVPAQLSYATYLGGDNSDDITDIAVDTAGNIYLAGRTDSSYFGDENRPNPTFGNAFVAKLDPSGRQLLYVYYLQTLAGNGGRYAIAVDANGCAYVAGSTFQTSNFTTPGAAQRTYGGNGDVFVAKLNAQGTGLVYATYLGGEQLEDVGIGIQEGSHALAVDAAGCAYITGYTLSEMFPTRNPLPGQGALHERSGMDVFVTKISADGSQFLFSTYLGGNQNSPNENGATFSIGNAIALDADANVYLTGLTEAADFPTVNPFQPVKGPAQEVFITKLRSDGQQILYSTFLGDPGTRPGAGYMEIGYDIGVDASGNIYVTGSVASEHFPLKNAFQNSLGNGSPALRDAFLTKLNPNNVGANQLIYSTYLGGSASDEAFALAVDGAGNAFVTGRTNSQLNFPLVNPLPNNNPPAAGGFIARFTPSGNATLNSYIGGGAETGEAIALNGFGDVIFGGNERGTFLPTTPDAIQPEFVGATDSGFLAIIEGGSKSFTATDADGDIVTLRLSGAGNLNVIPDGAGSIGRVVLRGTSATSSVLTFSLTKVGDGFVDVAAIVGSGLKEIAGSKVNLVGDGIDLTGKLGTLTLNNIRNGADVRAAGTGTTSIKAKAIGADTVIDVGNGLSLLKATSFGAGAVVAPFITTLKIAGSFDADLTLTGTGTVLTLATIVGAVRDATLVAQAGSIGIFQAGAFLNSSLTAAQRIQEFLIVGVAGLGSRAFVNSNVSAATVGRVILASVETDNGGVGFGVTADVSIQKVKVKNPFYLYNPNQPTFGDFEVNLI